MKLVEIRLTPSCIGTALAFDVFNAAGILIAAKGHTVASQSDFDGLLKNHTQLFIDKEDSIEHIRAYNNKLHNLVDKDATLRTIANTSIFSATAKAPIVSRVMESQTWLNIQAQAQSMLKADTAAIFLPKLEQIDAYILQQTTLNPDGALLALMQLSSSEMHLYSATHALFVSAICQVTARDILKWPDPLITSLRRAALTMNLGMTALQDQLTLQREPPTAAQRHQIDCHPALSVHILKQLDITDPHWLYAVAHHHARKPGALTGRTSACQMARLIQRADTFCAHLAPRATRAPAPSFAAMKASYFDENSQIDEAGAALVKAVGIYPPGTVVRLQTGETAMVIQRGTNTSTPRVAVFINKSGLPTGELIMRDTKIPQFKITSSILRSEIKVKLDLDKLLTLTKAPPSSKFW